MQEPDNILKSSSSSTLRRDAGNNVLVLPLLVRSTKYSRKWVEHLSKSTTVSGYGL